MIIRKENDEDRKSRKETKNSTFGFDLINDFALDLINMLDRFSKFSPKKDEFLEKINELESIKKRADEITKELTNIISKQITGA